MLHSWGKHEITALLKSSQLKKLKQNTNNIICSITWLFIDQFWFIYHQKKYLQIFYNLHNDFFFIKHVIIAKKCLFFKTKKISFLPMRLHKLLSIDWDYDGLKKKDLQIYQNRKSIELKKKAKYKTFLLKNKSIKIGP